MVQNGHSQEFARQLCSDQVLKAQAGRRNEIPRIQNGVAATVAELAEPVVVRR
jgi:hypothetical protein